MLECGEPSADCARESSGIQCGSIIGEKSAVFLYDGLGKKLHQCSATCRKEQHGRDHLRNKCWKITNRVRNTTSVPA